MGCSAVAALLARTSALVQVKRRGQYSGARLLALRAYVARTPAWRAALVLLLTPAPSLAVIAALEVVPLANPREGLRANRGFYARMFHTYLAIAASLQQQFCAQVGPALPISTATQAALALVITAVAMTAAYLLALAIGFPLPFTMQVTGPCYLLAEVFALGVLWRRFICADRSRLYDIARGCRYFLLQWLMILVYPVYYYGFTSIHDDELARMAFFGLLPIIKFMNRRLFDKVNRKAHGGADLTPMFVVLNADVVGSLFVAFSIQFKPTVVMSALVAGAKILQAILALWDFRADERKLRVIADRIILTSNPSRSSTVGVIDTNLVERAASILERTERAPHPPNGRSLVQVSSIRSPKQEKHMSGYMKTQLDAAHASISKGTTVAVVPVSYSINLKSQEQLEHTYVSMVRKLLYIAEVVVLIEYVEVVIPLLYCESLFPPIGNFIIC